MKITKIVGNCDIRDCPTIYETDRETALVQGRVTVDHGLQIPEGESVVEIPLDLLKQWAREHGE